MLERIGLDPPRGPSVENNVIDEGRELSLPAQWLLVFGDAPHIGVPRFAIVDLFPEAFFGHVEAPVEIAKDDERHGLLCSCIDPGLQDWDLLIQFGAGIRWVRERLIETERLQVNR